MPVYIDGYPMDLAISEVHGFESEVTEHPVERGADLVDHVRARPIEIELECVVSDTPIGAIASDPTRLPEGQDAPLPSDEAYARLLAIREARQPVTVETSLGAFKSMALRSLSVPRSRETTGGLFFTVSFREVRVLETQRVTVRTSQPNAKRKGRYGHRAGKRAGGRRIVWYVRFPAGTGELVGVTVHVDAVGDRLYYAFDVQAGRLPSATISGARARKAGEELDAYDRAWLSKDLARQSRDKLSRLNADVTVGALFDADTPTGSTAPSEEVFKGAPARDVYVGGMRQF